MANSGLKIVTKLRKYINGRPTDELRDNLSYEEGYIPNVISNKACPVGCDSVVAGSVIVKGTTTTSTTTTTTTSALPNLVKTFDISAPTSVGSSDPVKINFEDEYGVIQELDINPTLNPCYEFTIVNDGSPSLDGSYTYQSCDNSVVSSNLAFGQKLTVCAKLFTNEGNSLTVTNTLVPCATVVSKTTPIKTEGNPIVVEPVGSVFEATTTTTTLAPKTSNNYTLDTSSSSTPVVFAVVQIGQPSSTEVEVKPGTQTNISSDSAPVIVTTGQSAAVTDLGPTTPEEDKYTVVNNDFYNSTTVSFQPYGGLTDEIELSPKESLDINSQSVPAVTSGATNVSVTADGNPSQPDEVSPLDGKICDQTTIVNESNFVATFTYTDCNQTPQKVTLMPAEEISVSSTTTPVLTSDTATDVGDAFSTEQIQKDVGTSGSATDVIPPTTTTTTSTTTTTTTLAPDSVTETNIVSVQDANCDEPLWLIKPDNATWYPQTVKIKVGTKKGAFKFITYDAGVGSHYYKVYEGSTLLLDKAIINENYLGKFQRKAYDAFIDKGMSVLNATNYAYGTKSVSPQRVSGGKNNAYGSGGDTGYKTEFALNKTTFDEFITVEIYKPLDSGSQWSQFEIECIQ